MTATNYSTDDITLLIVDPYNDFMSEGGKLYERTKETAEAVGFYVDECRNRRLYLFARSRVV
jgi:nicotinamidase-related amidase